MDFRGSLSTVSKQVALDCEFVGTGWNASDNMLARVSIVDASGRCIYDKYVKPKEKITDYRTHVSGVQPTDLIGGIDFQTVQSEVGRLLKGRILVGQSVLSDLKVLYISHPKRDIRDTVGFPLFHKLCKSRQPSLKLLARVILGISIQENEHDSVTDARVAMQLYRLHRKQWEKWLKNKDKTKKRVK